MQDNQTLKKSILWNAVEPGDPYDIRKSMIARLPNDRRPFMGNRLELICLLQAAEIERLAASLEQYRLRYSMVERSQLDRHSYEVQIKQLAMAAQGEEQLRSENAKLKNFIDRLNQELQQMRAKISAGNNQLSGKYSQALGQIQTMSEQINVSKTEIHNLRQLLSVRANQLAIAQHVIAELQQKLERYEEDGQRIDDYQQKFGMMGAEIERLNSVLKSKTEETNRLRRYEEEARSRREENEFLISSQNQLNEHITSLEQQLIDSKAQLNNRQNDTQLQLAEDEIQRLMIQLERVQRERDTLQNVVDINNAKNEEIIQLMNEKDALSAEIQEENRKYQANSTLLTREVERLNSVLKTKLDEVGNHQLKINRLTEENTFYNSQIVLLERETQKLKEVQREFDASEVKFNSEVAKREQIQSVVAQLKRENSEIVQLRRERAELIQQTTTYQERISMMVQQIKRLNDIMLALQNQNRGLQGRIIEHERSNGDLRRLQKELADLKNLMLQEDNNKRNLQQRVSDLIRKSNDYQKLINDLSGQVQRLNEVLRTKLQECSILENKSYQLASERDRLQAALQSQNNNRIKLEDYQNKFALISLQIERLNSGLKNKIQEKNEVEQQVAIFRRENEELRRQNAEGQQWRSQNGDLRRQLAELSSKVGQVSQQKLQEYRRQLEVRDQQIESLNKTYDLRIQQYLVEIQRLNQILKLKLEELRQRENEIQRLESLQADTLKRLQQAKSRNREIADMERLNNLLRLKVEEAARWQISNHELNKKVDSLQATLEATQQDNHSLHVQIEDMASERKHYQTELNGYKVKVTHILKQVERLQQLLQNFKRENNDLRREINELKQQLSGGNLREKNQKLLEEIERLNRVVEQHKGEIRELRLILTQDYALEKRIKEQLALIVILFAQIESLRRRVQDKQKEVEQVRRESLAPLKA